METLQPAIEYSVSTDEETKNLQKKIEDDVWKKMMKERSHRDLRTKSNAALASKCRELCGAMEHFKQCNRDGGNEAPAPLKTVGAQRPGPATQMVRDLEEQVSQQNR